MPLNPRVGAKALRAIMEGANSAEALPLDTLFEEMEAAERVGDILSKMGYAIIENGTIRLTETGEALKNA